MLFNYVLEGVPGAFQRVGLPLVGIFPMISMFLVTSITMLRERTTGTLERLMTMPLAKIDLLFGYGLAFAAVAIVQTAVVCSVAIGGLGLQIEGSVLVVAGLAILNALLGMSFGLFVSAFASTEFQAVQFMPAFVFPQLVLCGLFAPRDSMAAPLEWLSDVLPMTYAYDAWTGSQAAERSPCGLADRHRPHRRGVRARTRARGGNAQAAHAMTPTVESAARLRGRPDGARRQCS